MTKAELAQWYKQAAHRWQAYRDAIKPEDKANRETHETIVTWMQYKAKKLRSN